MCRWLVFVGRSPVSLEDVVKRTHNSLIKQSFSATDHPGFTPQNNATLNADGCGLAWYKGGKAYLYKTTDPAWCDLNLLELAECVESDIILGHVRAASPGSVVSRQNCHPFRFGRLVFQHNGHIEQFSTIKRRMVAQLTDEAFSSILGNTDSEVMFALIVSNLKDAARSEPFVAEELKGAVSAAIEQVLDLLTGAGIRGGFTTLNMTLTDGRTVVCTRFCDKWPSVAPPSLEFCYERSEVLLPILEGGAQMQGPGDGSELKTEAVSKAAEFSRTERDYEVTHARWQEDAKALEAASQDPAPRALLISSEVLTCSPRVRWYPMPAQSVLMYTRGTEDDDIATRSRPQLSRLCCGQSFPLPDEPASKKQRVDG